MADYIGGIAILDRRDKRREHLHAFGFRDSKPPTYICIPIRPAGTPKTEANEWEYVIFGDKLAVTPSVRQTAGNDGPEIFHNTYSWEVPFKDVETGPYADLMKLNPDAAKHFE